MVPCSYMHVLSPYCRGCMRSYGDVVAMNDGERIYSVFVMVMGSTILAYIVGTVSTQAFNKDGGKGLQEQKLSLVRDYLAEQGTPKTLREAVMRHFCFALEKKTAFDEARIWKHLPHRHRHEVVMYVHRASIKKLPLFVKVKDTIMTAIFGYMEPCLAMRQTYVYNFETGSGGIYFILRGIAEVVDEDDDDEEIIVASIRGGMFFGHEKLLGMSTDFVGIRSRTDLAMLMMSDEHIATLKLQMPLAYNALTTLLHEALNVSTKVVGLSTTISDEPASHKSFLRSLSDTAHSSFRNMLGLPTDQVMKAQLKSQIQHHRRNESRIKQKNSSVEEFLEWLTMDMDESTWIKKSNMTHFQHKEKEETSSRRASSPSNILSMNSKDRYRLMKKERKEVLSTRSNSDDSVGDIKSNIMSSGRNSYIDLYGVRSGKGTRGSEREMSMPDLPGSCDTIPEAAAPPETAPRETHSNADGDFEGKTMDNEEESTATVSYNQRNAGPIVSGKSGAGEDNVQQE